MAMRGPKSSTGYRYVTSFVDNAGKRRYRFQRRGYKSVYLPDIKDPSFDTAYTKALTEMTVQRVAHKYSFDAAVDRYLKSTAFTSQKASSQRSTKRRLQKLAKQYGSSSIRDLTPRKLRGLLDKIDSPSERNRTLTMFRNVLHESILQEVISVNPAMEVKRVKHVPKSYAVWTREEIAQFLKYHAEGTTPHLAMQLMYRTGQRSSDVAEMGAHNLRNGRIRVTQRKTGSKVDIPLTPELERVLPQHNGKTWIRNNRMKPYTHKGFQQAFVKWARAAGIDGKSSHGVRAAVATHAAEDGATSQEIMAVTGHKSLSEVERYTKQAEKARLADSLFSRGKESNDK